MVQFIVVTNRGVLLGIQGTLLVCFKPVPCMGPMVPELCTSTVTTLTAQASIAQYTAVLHQVHHGKLCCRYLHLCGVNSGGSWIYWNKSIVV